LDDDDNKNLGAVAVNVAGDVNCARQWSADIPNLYTLTVTLETTTSLDAKAAEYSVQQVESYRVRFRTVDIHDGMVHVNGKRVTVCGMNRHEHDPDHGKVVSIEQMQQDICLLK
jgi:beta-galactosidase